MALLKKLLFLIFSCSYGALYAAAPAPRPTKAKASSALMSAGSSGDHQAIALRVVCDDEWSDSSAMIRAHRFSGDESKRKAEESPATMPAAAASAALSPVALPVSRFRRYVMSKILLNNSINNLSDRIPDDLAEGADPNTHDSANNAPLHFAANRGDANTIELLLAAKANVNAKGDQHSTPLAYAALRNDVPTMKLLLHHKADLTMRLKDGRSIFQLPSRDEAQVFLLNFADRKSQEEMFGTACACDDSNVTRRLLDHGFGINSQLDWSKMHGSNLLKWKATPLHIACQHPNAAKIIALLLERKADTHARTKSSGEEMDGFTPYGICFSRERIKISDLLLQAGACSDITSLGDEEFQRLLIGKSKEIRDVEFAAILKYRPRSFKILHTHGRITPDILRMIDLEKMLGPENGAQLSRFIIRGENAEVEKLLAKNRVSQHQLMQTDKAGMNPWLWAAIFGNFELLKVFMEKGKLLPPSLPTDKPATKWTDKCLKLIGKWPKPIPFNPLCTDELGNTAAMFARRRNDTEMINYLYVQNAPARNRVIVWIKGRKENMPLALSNHIAEFVYGGSIRVPATE